MKANVRLKILVTREVFDEVLEYLRQHFDVDANQEDIQLDEATLATRLSDKNGVMTAITDRVDEKLLLRCPKLKTVCNMAVGYNNIDLVACSARGVMATNTPGVLDETTADFTWALILAASRRLTEAEAYLRNGQWKRWQLKQIMGTDVHGKTLGILGMGRIGQAVAKRALGFDMTVIYHNRQRLPENIERSCRAKYVNFGELLGQSDILTLHLPYSASAHHVIGSKELAQMKPGAILINAARGGIVDDEALVAVLSTGKIAAAGLDVYENEPKLHPGFLKLKNVVLSPHIASSSRTTRLAMAMKAAENLVAALTTGKPPNLLNPEVKPKSRTAEDAKGAEEI
ncbi:MAG: 2-hydroxyacid dehydrogenase [Burkholderiales bacterium]